jgi:uroporphyrinogen-III synthase
MKRILITRPQASAVSLAEKIKVQLNNIEPIIFPAIEIMAVTENPFADINLNQINSIIFISPAAVENTAVFISTLPEHIKLFSIGQDSAEKIQALYLKKAIFPKDQFNSERLLNLKAFQDITNQNIIICKGAGGNNLILDTLTARGANVIEVIVYTRCLPKPEIFPDLSKIDLIISTSGESLHNLILLLGEAVKEKQLLVSSEKLKILAKTLGFKYPPLLAKNAGDEAIISKLGAIN